MKQSNTSPNSAGFVGVLQPLVDLLSRSPREAGRLLGQDVVLPRKDAAAIIALDSGNDTHLLIAPAAGTDLRYTRLDLRGLKIAEHEWAVAGRPLQRYLDITCGTGMFPAFRRPFLRFAEDVLYELVESGASPSEAVYRTGLRWRRFWSPETGTHITKEWLHGVFGELLFLETLVNRFGPTTVGSWTGPNGRPHDFQSGTDIAFEVKTSVQMPFTIQCGLNQLDPSIFKRMYIVCYRVSAAENGETLPSLVARIESAIRDDESMLDRFYEALAATGYRRELATAYAESPLDASDAAVFEVDESFPRITERSFSSPLDHRISNIHYTLTLTGLTQLSLDAISSDLARLSTAHHG